MKQSWRNLKSLSARGLKEKEEHARKNRKDSKAEKVKTRPGHDKVRVGQDEKVECRGMRRDGLAGVCGSDGTGREERAQSRDRL